MKPAMAEFRQKMMSFIPYNVYYKSMEFDKQEQNKIKIIFPHIPFGLTKESLLGDDFRYGPIEEIAKYFSERPTKPGIVFRPSVLGIELFLWAYGKSNLTLRDFLEPANQFEIDSSINIPLGYMKTKE